MKKMMLITICLVIAVGSFVYGQRSSLSAQESRFLTRPPGTRLKTYPEANEVSTNKAIPQKTTTKQKSGRERIEDLERQVLALTIRVEALEQQMNSISKIENIEVIQETPQILEQNQQEQLSDTDAQIQKMISEGVIHSVNIEYNEVRIDPLVWSSFTLEIKQNIVMFFSQYFKAKRGYVRVTILSNHSDKKLATHGIFRGTRILE